MLCDGRFGQTAGVEIIGGAFDSAPFLSQKEIDVPHIAAENSLADAVVGNIILLIGGKELFALQVLPLHLVE